ncbi:MAG: sterol desaturase family protein [Bdellovibrionia bacterium]
MTVREITLVSAAILLTVCGIIFPLRTFQRPKRSRYFLFHLLFSSLILGEVAILQKYEVFSGNFFNIDRLESAWFKSLVCILSLDLLSYFWHRLNHSWSFLWRWHMFHHQTEVMDPLAAYRFHPTEVFFGYQIRTAVIWILGFGAKEISVFVLVYGLLNLFQHSNLCLPRSVEKSLSRIFVTPGVHHVHHLRDRRCQNSNYSTIFIFWDKLFKSYTAPGVIRENDIGLNWSGK